MSEALAKPNIKDGTELMSPIAQPGSVGGLAEQSRAVAEIQAAYVMAMHRPRDQERAIERIMKACKRPSLAEKAEFSYPRGKETVQGPSIYLMQEIANSWGNVLYGTKELSRDDNSSEMQAYAVDLETNTRCEKSFVVKHWRDTKQGGYELKEERDKYEITANAGSRRLRSCLEKIIPADIIEDAKFACRRTLAQRPLEERIRKMVEAFGEMGVTPDMLTRQAGKPLDKLGHREITELIGIYQSIKDGEVHITEVFPVTQAPVAAQTTPPRENQQEDKNPNQSGQSQAPQPSQAKAQQAKTQPPKQGKPSEGRGPGRPPKAKQEPVPQAAQPEQPAAQQQSPQQESPQQDQAPEPEKKSPTPWDEVKDAAKQLYGGQARDEFNKLCEDQGFNPKNLSEENISALLNILRARLGESDQ